MSIVSSNVEFSNEVDHYKELGVWRNVTQEELKKAYRALARVHHTDKNMQNSNHDSSRMTTINTSYDILTDPIQRAEYDKAVARETLGDEYAMLLQERAELAEKMSKYEEDMEAYVDYKELLESAQEELRVAQEELKKGQETLQKDREDLENRQTEVDEKEEALKQQEIRLNAALLAQSPTVVEEQEVDAEEGEIAAEERDEVIEGKREQKAVLTTRKRTLVEGSDTRENDPSSAPKRRSIIKKKQGKEGAKKTEWKVNKNGNYSTKKNGKVYYQVDFIDQERIENGRKEYRVNWVGDKEEFTWKLASDLQREGCTEAVVDYENSKKKKSKE